MDTKQLILGVIAAGVTLLGAWLALQGTSQGANYSRIESLESVVREDAVALDELRRGIALLQLRLEASASISPRQVIDTLLESLTDYPSWCKLYDPDRDLFVMWVINSAYTDFYGISRAYYIGKTDYFVWGAELGDIYTANDRETYSRKDTYFFNEVVRNPDGTMREYGFWKGYVPLFNGTELVCGMQILNE